MTKSLDIFPNIALSVQQVDLVRTGGVREWEEEVVGVETDGVQAKLGPLVSDPVSELQVSGPASNVGLSCEELQEGSDPVTLHRAKHWGDRLLNLLMTGEKQQ